MPVSPPKDLKKLCIHTITNKPWNLEQAVEQYAKSGVAGVTVWRNTLEWKKPNEAGALIRGHGLSVVSLCRGGFFPAATKKERDNAILENKKIIDEAAELGAPLVVLVCGALPDQGLEESRKQIAEGIAAVIPHAKKNNVKLAIEPLHPVYADSRSAVNTMKQANDMCEALDSPFVGVAVDVYHVWWDPTLKAEIGRCGARGSIFAFHISDWRTPTEDLLNDRGLMGEGCINIRQIRGWVEAAGFSSYNEVEIFSNRRWAQDQQKFLDEILKAYIMHS